jgi:5-methylcytosine-specific restriction endonuclease McrA
MYKTYNCIICSKESRFQHSKSNLFCGQKCYQEHLYINYIDQWKQDKVDGLKGKYQTSNYIRRYVLEKQQFKCNICGIKNYNELPLTLELDHIDGNHKNNKETNLRCICPNCHSQTPTYKAKNKGNGRNKK